MGRRLAAVVLMFPLLVGLLGVPASPQVAKGDELSDAKAKQAQLKKDMAAQKAQVEQLAALQDGLAADIQKTTAQLRGINADLTVVRAKINTMQGRIDVVKADYANLVAQLATLNVRLLQVESDEAAKAAALSIRKALLADRVRNAYDTDRTSLLESFLSGGTFTDLLAEMSYYIDVGEQDKALAIQIAKDQEVLAALHQDVEDTRDQTDQLRIATAAQKAKLDASLKGLKQAKAELKKLEAATARSLAAQRATYAKIAANKKNVAKALAAAAKAQRQLAGKIADIVRRQTQQGHIPSQYNGTLVWPMAGTVTQPFGCTGFSWEPPLGELRSFPPGHRHRGPGGDQGPLVGRRDRRLHRLELCGRGGSGLDRHHRPQRQPADVVRPHAAGLSGRHHPGQPSDVGSGHRLRGQHRPLDRRPSPLGRPSQRRVREPAAVPVASRAGAAWGPAIPVFTVPQLAVHPRVRHRVLASTS